MMIYIFILCITLITYTNALFDYKLFHPTYRATYDLTNTEKPEEFAFYNDKLYFKAENDNYYVDNELVPDLLLHKIRQHTHGIFMVLKEPLDVNPLDVIGYTYISEEEDIVSLVGGLADMEVDVIYSKYHSRSLPVIEDGSFRLISGADGVIPFIHDSGFYTYDEVPHDHGNNLFTTIEDSMVNNRGLCARTTDGKYVCAGNPYIVASWDLMHEDYLSGNEDLTACATELNLYILKNGNIAWVRSSPPITSFFTNGNIVSMSCTESHVVAHTSTNRIYTFEQGEDVTIYENVEAYQTNRKQAFLQYFSGLHQVIDFVNDPFDFNNVIPGANGIVMTDVSTYVTNGTSMEAANPLATPTTLYVPDARVIHSCADGIILYLDGSDGEWKLYSHEDVSDLQTLLQTRYLVDISTTPHYGCMLIKMTDEHTGRDYTRPNYGLQQDNTPEKYEKGYYEDSDNDIILLAVSTTVMVITLSIMIYYYVRIKV